MKATAEKKLPETINVASRSRFPEGRTCSNFPSTPFRFALDAEACELLGLQETAPDGVIIGVESVEGFVAGLKAEDVKEQRRIFALHGKEAKTAGKALPVSEPRKVFFLGRAFDYLSTEHRALIEWAIRLKFCQNEEARKALLDTGNAKLTHNMGRFDGKPGKTSLPKMVFVGLLLELREVLNGGEDEKSFADVVRDISTDAHDEAKFYRPPEEE